jgi:CRISPR-associated protein Cmr2
MPNRILVKGELTREVVEKTLLGEWQKILWICREWVEDNIGIPKEDYHWAQKEEQRGKEKGEWERWGSYTWEIFIGWGRPDPNDHDKNLIKAAMDDLETRKLKRDWVAVNWMGESSSLSGTDAIAWHRLGDKDLIKRELKGELMLEERRKLKRELEDFYFRLSQALEEESSDGESPQGKFLRDNERLSIPELTKRLVTRYEDIGKHLHKAFKIDSFSEMVRMPEPGQAGHWTGWFMGDGDEIGKHLKMLKSETELKNFSDAMRKWGKDFKKDFPQELGRVVYAGGDDFMGVIYSEDRQKPISTSTALTWLTQLNSQWTDHKQPVSLSVGFVWAGHSVPQRDVLQHCREAEKLAKSLGRDRVTIRVVFNSGQHVQWTCPWSYLDILTKYRDRSGKIWGDPKLNWTHLYNDWATLKARHAIKLSNFSEEPDDRIALKIFELYFDDMERFEQYSQEIFKKEYTPKAVIEWLDGLVNVGWQLCSNT